MLGYTIQVGNLSPRPSISLIPVATPTLFSCTGIPACPEERRVYPENRRPCATVTTHLHRDSCPPTKTSFLYLFRRFAPRNLPAAPPQLVLQSLHASEHASGPLALLRRNLPCLMAHRPPGVPRVRRRNVHRFRCLWRHGSVAPMENAPRPLANRFRDRLRFDDDNLRPCILPPRPPHQIT